MDKTKIFSKKKFYDKFLNFYIQVEPQIRTIRDVYLHIRLVVRFEKQFEWKKRAVWLLARVDTWRESSYREYLEGELSLSLTVYTKLFDFFFLVTERLHAAYNSWPSLVNLWNLTTFGCLPTRSKSG